MSLINQMLRDLEARRVEEAQAPGWLAGLSPVQARHEQSRWRAHWPAAAIALAAVAFVAGGDARLDGAAGRVLDELDGLVAAVTSAGGSGRAPAAERVATPAATPAVETVRVPDNDPAPSAPLAPERVAGAPASLTPVSGTAVTPSPVPVETVAIPEPSAPPAAGAPVPFGLKLAYVLPEVPAASRDGLALPPGLRREAEQLNALIAAAPPAAAAPAVRPPAPRRVAPPVRAVPAPARSDPPSEAGALRKRALPQSPEQRAEASYRLGLAALRAGQIEHGLSLLRDALERWPGHGQAREVLAARLMRAGDLDGALALLEAGARVAPQHAGFAKLRARILVEGERLDEALVVLAAAPPDPAADPEYHALRAATLQRAGRHGEAARAYRAALAARPRAGVWWMGLGISLEAAGADVDALEAFTRALDSGALAGDVRRFVESRIRALRG